MLRVFVTESENGIDGYKSVEAIIIEHSRSRDGLNLFNYSSTLFLKKKLGVLIYLLFFFFFF